MQSGNQNGFAEFLRSRRTRLRPEAVGLKPGRRRRTPGLRREEVAELAGIGVDWYIRLEQGRAGTPSQTTIEALARALCLNKAEHAHLYALAQNPCRPAFVRETVPDTVRHVVEALNQPAYITGQRYDILVWNAATKDLFGDFGRLADEDRNILIYILTNADARRVFGEQWAALAQKIVAQFRKDHDLWAGDPAFVTLVERLKASSPEFVAWWDTHDVRNSGSGLKTIHLRNGETHMFKHATFMASEDPPLKLAIYCR